jgi:hypothetical protein
MGYVALSSALSVGKRIRCKYPKHGWMNVLKWHDGIVEKTGSGPNGKYAVVRSESGQYRTLRCDRMVDAILS